MFYQIADIFYSVKGEGLYTGFPMSFIRLAGCNKKCDFCDTNYKAVMMEDEHFLVNEVKKFPSRRVVITGGEPLAQDLHALMMALRMEGFLIHLETNASLALPTINFDWIAASPKDLMVMPSTMDKAHEIKIVYGTPYWGELAQVITQKYTISDKLLMMMPATTNLAEGSKEIRANVVGALDFCKNNPRWRFCAQVHKLVGFK